MSRKSKHGPSGLMKQSVGNSYILIFFLLFFNITLAHLDGNHFFFTLRDSFNCWDKFFFLYFCFTVLLLCVARPANWCTYIILYVIHVHVYRIPFPVQINDDWKPTERLFRVKKKKKRLKSFIVDDWFESLVSALRFECSCRWSLMLLLIYNVNKKTIANFTPYICLRAI